MPKTKDEVVAYHAGTEHIRVVRSVTVWKFRNVQFKETLPAQTSGRCTFDEVASQFIYAAEDSIVTIDLLSTVWKATNIYMEMEN